jgi:hypothetical protein
MAAVFLILLLPVVLRIVSSAGREPPEDADRGVFPWWGWAGTAMGTAAWVLAWTRFAWFAPLQRFTFTPLWLSYVIVVNALTQSRRGDCMLSRSPLRFLLLFPASAAFWWYFEYINHFMENWSYHGSAGLAAWRYVVEGTLPFSTVLPAVAGTRELLGTFPRLSSGLDDIAPVPVSRPRLTSGLFALAGCILLFALGILPALLYPFAWIAPTCVLAGLGAARRRRTMFSEAREGDWRNAWLYALAGLVCGVFWEMWNAYSLVGWTYHVSYVQALHVFEMPILGYGGYLPFGMFCGVVIRSLGLGPRTDR